MTSPTHDNTLAQARVVISSKRAREILQLKHWEHGMCGCLNAVKPDVDPISEIENRLIHELWNALPGSSCWISALFLLTRE
jgi:hypothetical protein